MRTGVFGGTFDPVHAGHLAAIEAARQELGLDEVLVVPAGSPRLKASRPGASGMHRLEMARQAALALPGVAVSDLEMRRPGPTYTVDTLEALAPGRELFLLLGTDALRQIGLWRAPGRVVQLARVAVLERPGQPDDALSALEAVDAEARGVATVVGGPLVEISSTEVRRRLRRGRSVTGLVPVAVERYIANHGLYHDEGAIT